jgi:hypothetical protein
LRDIEACLRAQKNKLYHIGNPWRYIEKHSSQRQQGSRLANLRRLCSSSYRYCSEPLQRRRFWCRTGRNRLRTRFHHDRSQLIDFSLGPFSVHQSR